VSRPTLAVSRSEGKPCALDGASKSSLLAFSSWLRPRRRAAVRPPGSPSEPFALTQSVPAMPTDLTATAISATKTRLHWTDNANDETGYEVSNGVESRALGANGTGYDWGGQAAGTPMCFKVRAVNAAGPSPWYPNVPPFSVCAMTFRPPAAPTWIGLTAGDETTFSLQWLDHADNEAGFQIADDRRHRIWAPGRPGRGATGVNWPGHRPGESRCFRLRAVNALASAWTGWACATTPTGNRSTEPRFACPTGGACETQRAMTNLAFPPMRALTRRRASLRARRALARFLGRMYADGAHKRLTCRRTTVSTVVCSASWHHGRRRYRGRIVVQRDGLVRTQILRRRVQPPS
jgi:hypothetical protein